MSRINILHEFRLAEGEKGSVKFAERGPLGRGADGNVFDVGEIASSE